MDNVIGHNNNSLCELCTVPRNSDHYRNAGKQMTYHIERKKIGERSRGEERMGDRGIMTGWERHLCGESGKRVQAVGTEGHTFMLKKCASPQSSSERARVEEYWGS